MESREFPPLPPKEELTGSLSRAIVRGLNNDQAETILSSSKGGRVPTLTRLCFYQLDQRFFAALAVDLHYVDVNKFLAGDPTAITRPQTPDKIAVLFLNTASETEDELGILQAMDMTIGDVQESGPVFGDYRTINNYDEVELDLFTPLNAWGDKISRLSESLKEPNVNDLTLLLQTLERGQVDEDSMDKYLEFIRKDHDVVIPGQESAQIMASEIINHARDVLLPGLKDCINTAYENSV